MSQHRAIKPNLRWLARQGMESVAQFERENQEYCRRRNDLVESLELRRCIGLIAELLRKIVSHLIYDVHRTSLEIVNLVIVRSANRK